MLPFGPSRDLLHRLMHHAPDLEEGEIEAVQLPLARYMWSAIELPHSSFEPLVGVL